MKNKTIQEQKKTKGMSNSASEHFSDYITCPCCGGVTLSPEARERNEMKELAKKAAKEAAIEVQKWSEDYIKKLKLDRKKPHRSKANN